MTTPPSPAIQLSVRETLRCHLVSHDPLIIISYGLPLGAPMQLSPHLAHRKAYFLMGNWWSLLDRSVLLRTKQLYGLMRDLYPRHEFIFLTNAQEENALLERIGLPNYRCHHNAFLDESIFRPLPEVEKDLDAVYTARPLPFKRHTLARRIPAWELLYYFDPAGKDKQEGYLRHLQRTMPGMVLPNHDPVTGAYRRLNPYAMTQAINRARVGLCLSQVEGGNYATTEYMLCGLPVVSTPSQGGRDAFLDPDISRVVEPDPRAVAQAVTELIALELPPRLVRLRTLITIREQRQDFIRLIEALYEREGRRESFADRFSSVFTHKMLTYPGTPEQFLARHGLLPDQPGLTPPEAALAAIA
jgi:glycosyltransferase involved in cell wall biosynthesis